MDEVLNLDAMDKDELFKIGISRNHPTLYSEYARHKFTAMKYREEGKIERAIFYEKMCDRVYGDMSDSLRW